MSVGGCELMVDEATGSAPLDVRYRIREVETILAMVASGMGVTLIPRLALPDTPPADVAFVPLATDHVRRVGLAVRKQEDRASPARALLKLVLREGGPPRRL
jgi:DNA-binding transcriptional LysR family regulator